METNPQNIYSYSKHFIFFNKLLKSNKLPKSILISGEEGIGKKIFMFHFLLSTQDDNYKFNLNTNYELFKKLTNNELYNIKILKKNNNVINIDQIRELITHANKTSIDGKAKFILIANIEDLNINASNALLKILENPPYNTHFFLIKNTESFILDTIVSRCFQYKIKFSFEVLDEIFNKLLFDYNLKNFENYDIFSKFDTPGSKISRILYLKKNNIENESLINIILFCLNDYQKNKNFFSLKYFSQFAKFFFSRNCDKNLYKNFRLYEKFINLTQNNIKYNTDLSLAAKIFND